MKQWYLWRSGAGPAALNMALDEALLEAAPHLARPVLRFYDWSEPAATFGFFQKYSEVAAWTALRPLIRRPTGGGLVSHLTDWTYSLVLPPNDPWYSLTARASYQRLHQWLQQAFLAAGVTTHLAEERRKEATGQCFIAAEQFDLVWGGRKIAGAAQRRTRHGLLIQGSVQGLPAGADKARWEAAMCEAARSGQQVVWSKLVFGEDLNQSAHKLAREKYSQPSYNLRR